MQEKEIDTAIYHELPEDIKDVLVDNLQLLEKWNSLTPIARNEWICWVTIVKQDKTRKQHIERL